jgi:hypothetical protein
MKYTTFESLLYVCMCCTRFMMFTKVANKNEICVINGVQGTEEMFLKSNDYHFFVPVQLFL